ncbi:cytochrome P450 [Coniochaeta sp. 2T2.1]|nr:cytochrome P450 [Coniochaeta sp. 2T2.1]
MDVTVTTKLLAGSVGLFTVWITCTCIYRLFFHPLAKFPGPKLNCVSSLPAIISLLRGRLPMDTKLLHDLYGPVVRVSPNELSFDGPHAWDDIYGHRAGHLNMHKDPIHVGSVEAVPGVTTLTMSNDEVHARQRRALSHPFSMKALLGQQDIVNSHVTKLMAAFKRLAKEEQIINVVDWYNFTTFDVIGDLCFAEPFGCLDEGEWHFWVKMIYETVKSGAIEQATRRIATVGSPLQKFLMNLIPGAVKKFRKDHLTYSNEKTLRRLADEKGEHRDFIYYILRNNESKQLLTKDEILVNSALFIVAGSETTASFLAGWTNLLMRYRDVYDKLVAEVRSTFSSEDDIRFEVLKDLPYMSACINEAMRVFPPVPAGLLRTVPRGGDTVSGYFVPEKTSVAVSSWAATHSARNFREPDRFIPERWLDQAWDSDKKKASQPFSLGPRGCIGRNLSYMEQRLIMGRLLWNFDVFPADEAKEWDTEGEMKYMRAFLTWEKPDLNIKLVPVVR